MRIVPFALLAAVLALVLNQYSKSIGVLLTIACCVAVCVLGLSAFEPLLDFLTRVRILGNLDENQAQLLIKAVGMSVLVELTCGVCEDAGQGSVGKLVRLVGNCALVMLALPLMETVLDLLEKLLGG